MLMCYNMCTDVDNTDMLYLDKDKKKKGQVLPESLLETKWNLKCTESSTCTVE